jgi:uncharacterized membrane protein YczE
MNVNRENLSVKRILIYLLGILTVSLGIVLCKKCGLGISPISSIPFVLSDALPLTFGNLTTLFHFINMIAQMLLTKKLLDPKLWLQALLAFVFGWVIDWLNQLIIIDDTVLAWQILALILSIFFTALGMVMMIDMNLIQNPPDGTVKQISMMLHIELGNVKIAYDVVCVVISILLGLVFLRRVTGFGIATIASAIFVGKTISWIRLAHTTIRKMAIARLYKP